MTLPVAVLAGGLATRLHPLTQTIPKSLILVAGKPFIDWQLDYLKKQEIQQVVLCLGYLGEQIQSYLSDGKRYDFELIFSSDGSELLGTGGALRRALPVLGDAFFVLYGDSYVPISFRELEEAFYDQEKPACMSIIKNKNQWDKSNVWFENGTLLEYNKCGRNTKMSHIDYGLSILSASVLTNYPLNEPFDLADVYHTCSLEGSLFGHEVFSRFYEIGSFQGQQETSNFLALKG